MPTLNNQSLVDVALQEYGSIEGLVDIALRNGKSITSDLQVGEVLQIGEVISKDVAQYFKVNNLKVATGAEMFYPTAISVSPSTLSFGVVTIGSTKSLSFVIQNNSKANLVVSSITFPYTTYTADWSSGTIAIGDSQTVNVTYTPTTAVTQNGTITVNSNAVSGINTVAVTGIGFREIGVKFDGATNYAQATYSAGNTFAHTSAFTYSFYLRMANVSLSQIVMERESVTNSQTLLIEAGIFEFVKYTPTGYQFVRASTTLSIDTLYKVDLVSEGGNVSQIKIYINNVLQTLFL